MYPEVNNLSGKSQKRNIKYAYISSLKEDTFIEAMTFCG